MELQDVCDSLLEETEGLLACVVLDLDTGLTIANSSREGRDAVAVAHRMGSLFRSKAQDRFVQSVAVPSVSAGDVREAQVTTGGAYHFMATLPGWSSALLIFVTERTISIGLGWMAVHQALDRVSQARPGTVATETQREPQTSQSAAPHGDPSPPEQRPADARHEERPAVMSREPVAPPRQAPTRGTHSPPGVGTVPTRARQAPAAATHGPPATGASPESDGHAQVNSGRLEPTESVRGADNAEPPVLAVPDVQRTRQGTGVRPRRPSPIPAAKDPAEPPDGKEAKTLGRMGARAVFGSKTRRP